MEYFAYLNMTMFFILRHSERSEESHNLSEEYILRTFSVGYFANAQYDVLFLLVFASMPSEQTPGRVEKHVILNEVKNPTT